MLLTNAFVLHFCPLDRPNASGFRPLTNFIEIRFALVQSRGDDRRDQKSMKNLNIPAGHCGLLFSDLYRVQSSFRSPVAHSPHYTDERCGAP